MKLRKVYPAQRGPGYRTSAWWEFEDYPGLFIQQESKQQARENGRGGRPGWEFDHDYQEQTELYEMLKNQVFPTRREALQALEGALLIIGEQELEG